MKREWKRGRIAPVEGRNMADELMTTRELQEFLRLDRTTIYNLLSEGKLPGFKVGGQWRFSRQEIEAWLREQQVAPPAAAVQPSPDVLPVDCVQSIQAIFAEAMDVGSVVTRLDGEPLTQISNSCAFCDLILGTPEGYQRCVGSWMALANQRARRPKLYRCHAGLLYARGRIEVEDEFVAMVFAGQIIVDGALETVEAGIEELASACNLPPDRLREALPSIRRRDAETAERLMDLLGRLGETLSGIGLQRLVLLRKLRHIAEVTAV